MARRKSTPKQPWKVATGHRPHMTGGGRHDSRPNRQRTRATARRAALRDG